MRVTYKVNNPNTSSYTTQINSGTVDFIKDFDLNHDLATGDIPADANVKETGSKLTFKGWNESSTATIANAQPNSTLATNVGALTQNKTYYAIWGVRVTYVPNPPSGYTTKINNNTANVVKDFDLNYQLGSATGDIPEDSTVTETTSTYVFAGWNTDSTATTGSDKSTLTKAKVKLTQNTTYNAIWKLRTYNLDINKLKAACSSLSPTTLKFVKSSAVPSGLTNQYSGGVGNSSSAPIGVFKSGTTVYVAPMTSAGKADTSRTDKIILSGSLAYAKFGNSTSNFGTVQNLDITNMDTSGITDLEEAFRENTVIKTINAKGCDFSRCSNLDHTLYSCTSLTTLNVTNCSFAYWAQLSFCMAYCTNLTTIYYHSTTSPFFPTGNSYWGYKSTKLVGAGPTSYADDYGTQGQYFRVGTSSQPGLCKQG